MTASIALVGLRRLEALGVRVFAGIPGPGTKGLFQAKIALLTIDVQA
jgi:hypothetical protein